MNSHYNQNYTREQIDEILEKIKECVTSNKYTISQNQKRQENIDLINEYNITSYKQKTILFEIQSDDFCHSVQNIKIGYEHEILYVFVPSVKLFNIKDEEETVDIYTKFNVIDMPSGARTVVISFHKLNKPIDYLFR